MKRSHLVVVTAALPVWAAAADLSLHAGLLSEKVVRGLGQSNRQVSAVADIVAATDTGWAWQAGLATLGTAAGRARAEVSVGGSRSGPLGADGAWQLSAARYAYIGNASDRSRDYTELAVGAGWRGRLQVSLAVSPRLTVPSLPASGRRNGPVAYAEGTWHQPLGRGFALDLGIGSVDYGSLAVADYRYGNVGASWRTGRVTVFATRIFSGSTLPVSVRERTVVSVLLSH